ncbi:glycoside hydrolase family 3 N-terminal domain-containing protein [Alistipes sp.]|uniref:glycoside hydrolase family 3 N-terminal domain-containing protein n=1 Tax=Alistipes sp. TaxID=1872444 RepID=UPI003AEFECA3
MKQLLILLAAGVLAACGGDDKWRDASLAPRQRAALLVREMTLDEKLGQLRSPYGWEMYSRTGDTVQLTEAFRKAVCEEHIGMLWGTFRADPWTQKDLRTGLTPLTGARLANRMQRYVVEHSRLGIPLFLAEEAPHGHMAIGATVFPTALGQAATWDPRLIERMGAAIASEIRAQGGHIAYGPVLDVVRDPRWSRTEECYGEDPFLTAAMGRAFVTGLGSQDLSGPGHALSTLKHFIAYGASEGGQNGGSNSLGRRELRETYLPPFRAALEAGARSVMTAYNSVDGVPCTANRRLLTDLLRGEWGFEGFVISDLVSIEGLYETHGVAADKSEAAAKALRAGVDVDLRGDAFATLRSAVEEGLIPEREIDRAVCRVLALKFEMGLFENPYVDETLAAGVGSEEHTQLALDAARESITLLENRGVLPLDPASLGRVAVVGPNADNIYNQLGDYTARQTAANTVRDGLERALGRERVEYVRGCGIRDEERSGIAAAVAAARRSDAVVAVVGGSSARDFGTEFLATGAARADSRPVNDMECGEGNDRATLSLLGAQEELLRALKATGKPLVVVYVAGRPLDMTWATAHADALVAAWYPGQRGGDAVADVLLGRVNPAGRLPLTVPRSVGQLPVHYNRRRPANHDYTDQTAAPLYPFGYGLSYSSFEYTGLEVLPCEDGFRISCSVRNTSRRAGDEVVQLYVSDPVASTVRPLRQLCAFERVTIPAGETRTVVFVVGREQLALVGVDGQWCVEPGTYEFQIGSSSAEIKLKKSIEL